jgi:hypothetical protein
MQTCTMKEEQLNVTSNSNNLHHNGIGMPAACLHHYHTFLPSYVELLGQ